MIIIKRITSVISAIALAVPLVLNANAGNTNAKSDTLYFADVAKEDWYYESTSYCIEHGYMSGVKEGIFNPQSSLTRAMAVQLIYNISSDNSFDPSGVSYDDVSPEHWAYKPIEWAKENSIVLGTTERTFSPDSPIRRQDFIRILMQSLAMSDCTREIPEPDTSKSIKSFTDYGEISDYAIQSMEWAVQYGLVVGYDGGAYLHPSSNVTRAETATLLMRFQNTFGHTYELVSKDGELTCTSDSKLSYKCTACGAERTTSQRGCHLWKLSRTAKEAGCTECGTDIYTCLRCGNEKSETVPPKGHRWISLEIVPRTHSTGGYTKQYCNQCGEIRLTNLTEKLERTEQIDANGDGKITVDEYFGAFDIVQYLYEHATDFLCTPYDSITNHLYEPEKCMHDIGSFPKDPGMNCTGFVARVLKKCGGNMALLPTPRAGGLANANNWYKMLSQLPIYHEKYTTINELLNSGKLRRGDILLFLPKSDGDDFHLGFFWGSTSSENRFWHSGNLTEYAYSLGLRTSGNQVSPIVTMTPYSAIYVLPLQR